MKKQALVVEPRDNVATALVDIAPGTLVKVEIRGETREIKIVESIPFGHKFAVEPVAAGEDVIKYGESIGRATRGIHPGQHVHVHNLESVRGRGDLAAKGAGQ